MADLRMFDDTEWLYAPDEVYARRAGVTLKMQLIYPRRHVWAADERFPVVVYIPGAAWRQQDMYSSVPQWAKLAERGMVVAAVQVRASTEACFPAQTTDVMDAIRALARDAARWHIDPHRMYLMGASSGGHLALMTMLMRMQELAQAPDFTLRGVIAQSAPTDLWRCGEKPTLDLLGLRQLAEDPEAVRDASCGAYIRREVPLPRILLMHGTADDVVPPGAQRPAAPAAHGGGQGGTLHQDERGGPWRRALLAGAGAGQRGRLCAGSLMHFD